MPTATLTRSGKISSGGATEQPLPSFEYSELDWAKIEHSIRVVRQEPMSRKERQFLQQAASQYRHEVAARTAGTYRSPLQAMAAWKRAAELCRKLRKALVSAAKAKNSEYWKIVAAATISKELAAKLGEVIRPNVAERLSFQDALQIIDCGDLVTLLTEVETHLRKMGSDPYSGSVSKWKSVSGQLEPSVVFYQRILFLWTEFFDGKLKFSRRTGSNQIDGPLVRYLIAVTEPVMGDKRPSLENIPDIVAR